MKLNKCNRVKERKTSIMVKLVSAETKQIVKYLIIQNGHGRHNTKTVVIIYTNTFGKT